jgi:hypothetical protein
MSRKCLGHILLIEDNPLDVDLTMRALKKSNLANPIGVACYGYHQTCGLRKVSGSYPSDRDILAGTEQAARMGALRKAGGSRESLVYGGRQQGR